MNHNFIKQVKFELEDWLEDISMTIAANQRPLAILRHGLQTMTLTR